MKEFIRKWSSWWILNPRRKQLDDAFEKELNELIEREVALRIHNVTRQSEQLVCDCGNRLTDKEIYFGQCLQCNKNIEEAN